MERNIESTLSELGIDYRFYRNIKNKTIFRNLKPIQQAKEEDLSYCSFDGEEAVSLISKSSAGIILCEKGLEGFIDQYGQRLEDLRMKHERQQLVFVDNPRAVFIKIVNKIYPKNVKTGYHLRQ